MTSRIISRSVSVEEKRSSTLRDVASNSCSVPKSGPPVTIRVPAGDALIGVRAASGGPHSRSGEQICKPASFIKANRPPAIALTEFVSFPIGITLLFSKIFCETSNSKSFARGWSSSGYVTKRAPLKSTWFILTNKRSSVTKLTSVKFVMVLTRAKVRNPYGCKFSLKNGDCWAGNTLGIGATRMAANNATLVCIVRLKHFILGNPHGRGAWFPQHRIHRRRLFRVDDFPQRGFVQECYCDSGAMVAR